MMPEPPQLAPPDMEEEGLYPKLLPESEPAPHPAPIGVPRYSTEETNFSCWIVDIILLVNTQSL